MIKETKNKDINVKNNSDDTAVTSDSPLHSEAIKENLDNVNMEAWYYIYQNYVNPGLKKKIN
ncbi:MAG: hypothetical protein OER82_06920 [Nitrosopumilus sp.]|nr:hypothetical protein [Nitrosopumilus sp.]